MKKIILLILIAVLVAACQQAVQKDAAMEKESDVMKKPAMQTPNTAGGDPAVDAVGSDVSNAENVENSLSSDNLGDLDSGFNEVQNI